MVWYAVLAMTGRGVERGSLEWYLSPVVMVGLQTASQWRLVSYGTEDHASFRALGMCCGCNAVWTIASFGLERARRAKTDDDVFLCTETLGGPMGKVCRSCRKVEADFFGSLHVLDAGGVYLYSHLLATCVLRIL